MNPAAGIGVCTGNFRAGYHLYPVPFAQNYRPGNTSHCIVVCNSDKIQPCPFGVKNNILQTGGTIGKLAVANKYINILLTKRAY